MRLFLALDPVAEPTGDGKSNIASYCGTGGEMRCKPQYVRMCWEDPITVIS